MVRSTAKILTLVALITLISCATPVTKSPDYSDEELYGEELKQKGLAVAELHKDLELITALSYPILKENAELCEKYNGKAVLSYGFSVASTDMFPGEYKAAAKKFYGLSGDAAIVRVATPRGPAGRAGLKTGDKILAINGYDLNLTDPSLSETSERIRKLIKKEEAKQITMTIERDGEKEILKIVGERACDYNVDVRPDPTVNAYTDGHNLVFYRGLLRLVSPENVQVVFAHELAHAIMGHVKASQKNRTIGELFGFLLDAASFTKGSRTGGYWSETTSDLADHVYSQDFETEADYVSIYLLARADIDISKSAETFRELGIINPQSTEHSFLNSHPSTPERFIKIEATIEEIKNKKENNQPLFPEFREGKSIEDIL